MEENKYCSRAYYNCRGKAKIFRITITGQSGCIFVSKVSISTINRCIMIISRILLCVHRSDAVRSFSYYAHELELLFVIIHPRKFHHIIALKRKKRRLISNKRMMKSKMKRIRNESDNLIADDAEKISVCDVSIDIEDDELPTFGLSRTTKRRRLR